MCSYCGCRELTFIGRLSTEHEQIIEATGELRRAGQARDAEAASRSARLVQSLLDPHTAYEEHGLFAELSALDGFAEHVASLSAEHVELDAALARIRGGDASGVAGFIARLRGHIDREENGLFPAAAIALDVDAMQRLDEASPWES